MSDIRFLVKASKSQKSVLFQCIVSLGLTTHGADTYKGVVCPRMVRKRCPAYYMMSMQTLYNTSPQVHDQVPTDHK